MDYEISEQALEAVVLCALKGIEGVRALEAVPRSLADVFRRGRNASPHSIPKAASREEYQTATALEALFGWLYLQGRTERLNALFSTMMGD